MPETRKKILVVDDDRFAQKMVGRALSDIYEVRFADGGDAHGMIFEVLTSSAELGKALRFVE